MQEIMAIHDQAQQRSENSWFGSLAAHGWTAEQAWVTLLWRGDIYPDGIVVVDQEHSILSVSPTLGEQQVSIR